jgi:hypothetical protein
VTFDEEQKNLIKTLVESNRVLEAQDLILSAIEQQVGGTAEAIAPASEKIRLAFDSIKDAIGLALLPVLEQAVPQIQAFVDNMITSPEFQQFLTDMGTNFQNMLTHLPTVVANLTSFGRDVLPAIQAFFPMINDALSLLGSMFFDIENTDPASSTNDFASAMQTLAKAFSAVGAAMRTVKTIYDGLPQIFKMNLFESLNPDQWLKRLGVQDKFNPFRGPPKTNLAPSATMGRYPGTAKGGVTAMGGMQWVGEKGPELVSLPEGATVTPIPQHMRADNMFGANRSGGGGNLIQITVNGGLDSSAQIGEAVVNAIRKYERTSGAVFARA